MEESRFSVRAALLVAVLGTVFSWPYLDPFFGRSVPVQRSGPAAISENIGEETSFDSPLPANWEGRIIAVLEGGHAYAIERDDGQRFYAYIERPPIRALQGRISVRGRWLGITCAYRHTVFDGQCVPDVVVRTIASSSTGI